MIDKLNSGFREKYTSILKEEADAFFEALNRDAGRHVRITSHRDVNYLAEFDYLGIEYEKLDGLDSVYKIKTLPEKVPETISFLTGGVYIMNPSSVLPAQILVSEMPDEPAVLDVSAAPGGKTVALADMMQNNCLLVANELSSKRLKSLNYNLEKHSCWCAKTTSYDGRLLSRHMPESFDGILLDAPCSNENKIARNQTVNGEWCQDYVERMAKLQKELLESAYGCLKPGGVLVYSTCTFSVEENEEVITHALENFEDCEIVDINLGEYEAGFSGNAETDPYVVRVMPHKLPFDGFFIGAIRKTGTPKNQKNQKLKYKPGLLEKHFEKVPANINICKGKDRSFIETSLHPKTKARFSKSGIMAYRRENEISSQLFWDMGSKAFDKHKININYDDAINYLKGFDIPNSNDYHGMFLYWNEIPVGCVKVVGNTLKNKLDRYFLYGRDIRW